VLHKAVIAIYIIYRSSQGNRSFCVLLEETPVLLFWNRHYKEISTSSLALTLHLRQTSELCGREARQRRHCSMLDAADRNQRTTDAVSCSPV